MFKTSTKDRVSCHCGSIQLDIFFSEGIKNIVRCNCSICIKNKGFGMVCVPLEDVVLIEGNESMTEYKFNSMDYPHVFCIICGTHTHHKNRSTPGKVCINVACINRFDINLLNYYSRPIK